MNMTMLRQYKVYYFPVVSVISILLGGLVGYYYGHSAAHLKPLADIFLNLIFTVLVPLVFFSIASAVARIGKTKQLWKLFINMFFSFLFTGVVAALFMLVVVKLFPPAQGIFLKLSTTANNYQINLADQLVKMLTVSHFGNLFSHENILALVFFSALLGLATAAVGEKGRVFAQFLQSGADTFMQLVSFVMYYAPIGFFAYFAVLVSDLGPKLLMGYLRLTMVYYVAGVIYFILAFTWYAYLAGKKEGIKLFWKTVFLPMMTSLATCSSSASIPANLQAAKRVGVPPDIYETIIPFGAIIHKDGSVLGGVIKIAFLFGIYHIAFGGLAVLSTALVVALLVGTVMGAIPSGGMLGELLIVSLYGFQPQALIMLAAISIIIDPLATMLNVTGDIVCSMLVARLMEGRDWFSDKAKNPEFELLIKEPL